MAEAYYTSAEGLELFYRDIAADQSGKLPVMCLPGLTRNSRDYLDLVPHLAEERRVICPDFRGRGRSAYDPHYMNYQPLTYAQDVIRLCEDLGLDRVVVIGTSLGGLVAMVLSMLKPELLAGVVINDVGPELDPRGIERIKKFAGNVGDLADWEAATATCRQLNEFSQPDRPDSFWSEFARRLCREDDKGVPYFAYDPKIGDALRETPAADPEAVWAAFAGLAGIPKLLLRGARSDLLSSEIAEAMRARQPELTYVEVPGVGHPPYLDEPEALGAIKAFLAELP
ncbi:MAG: alpha/beta hydrolase [Alphaproteobacteria bacterium]|nr:MAG: alpha/beta hydrolase [Alphaproteobacteria bacterium]